MFLESEAEESRRMARWGDNVFPAAQLFLPNPSRVRTNIEPTEHLFSQEKTCA